jgi:hypothetical protein
LKIISFEVTKQAGFSQVRLVAEFFNEMRNGPSVLSSANDSVEIGGLTMNVDHETSSESLRDVGFCFG